MVQRFSTNFSLFAIAMDCLLIIGSIFCAPILYQMMIDHGFVNPLTHPFVNPVGAYILIPLIWLVFLFFYSVYDGKKTLKIIDEFTFITNASIISFASIAAGLFVLNEKYPRVILILLFISGIILLILWRIVARVMIQRTGLRSDQVARSVIIGDGQNALNLRKKFLALDTNDFQFAGFVAKASSKIPEVIGTLDDLERILNDEQIDHIFIALPREANEELNQVISIASTKPIKISIMPDFFDLTVHNTRMYEFDGIPMLDIKTPALTESQRLAKRIFDLFFVLILLIPGLPVMALVALAIWVIDGSPVLFKQERIGENGKIIQIYKFRTMIKNAEELPTDAQSASSSSIKTPNDPRVTKLGRILRKASLDELPQFFNVLGGTISLVGPRPELSKFRMKYQPWQNVRQTIPQGLTGWWQVNGRSDNPLHLSTEYDIYYIENYSIWLDIFILLKTFWIVLRGKGAY